MIAVETCLASPSEAWDVPVCCLAQTLCDLAAMPAWIVQDPGKLQKHGDFKDTGGPKVPQRA